MKLTNTYGETLKIKSSDYSIFEELAFDQQEMATLVAQYLDVEETDLLEALVLSGFRLADASKKQQKIVRLAQFWSVGFTGRPDDEVSIV